MDLADEGFGDLVERNFLEWWKQKIDWGPLKTDWGITSASMHAKSMLALSQRPRQNHPSVHMCSYTYESVVRYRMSDGEEKDKWERFHVRSEIMSQPDCLSSNFNCSLVGMPESWHHPGFYIKLLILRQL